MVFQLFCEGFNIIPVWVHKIHQHPPSSYDFSFCFPLLIFLLFLNPFPTFCLLSHVLFSFSFIVSSSWTKEYSPRRAIFLSIFKQPTSIHWLSVRRSVLPSYGLYSWPLNLNCLPSEIVRNEIMGWMACFNVMATLGRRYDKGQKVRANRRKSSPDCDLVSRAH